MVLYFDVHFSVQGFCARIEWFPNVVDAAARAPPRTPWSPRGAVHSLPPPQEPLAEEDVDTSWLGHVPELNPGLTPAPYGACVCLCSVCGACVRLQAQLLQKGS